MSFRLSLAPELVAKLERSDEIVAGIRRDTPERFRYSTVSAAQFRKMAEAMVQSGHLRKEGASYSASVADSKDFQEQMRAVTLYNQTSQQQHFNGFIHGRKILLPNLWAAFRWGIESSNLHAALPIARSILEHTAHLWALLSECRVVGETDEPQQAIVETVKFGNAAQKSIFGTRIDFSKVVDPERDRRKAGQFAYDPKDQGDLAADLTAKGILGYVDRLEKRLPGVRLCYEILCEFTHPNIGTTYLSTSCVSQDCNVLGVILIEREISRAPPPESSLAEGIVHDCLLSICDAIELWPEMLVEAADLSKKVLHLNRCLLTNAFRGSPNIRESKAQCPCGSGKSIRECCGR